MGKLLNTTCVLLIVVVLLQQSQTAAYLFRTNSIFLQSVVSVGAVCLDGNRPAYLFGEGYGKGKLRWVVYLLGGDWFSSIKECIYRKTSHLGSSHPQYWNDSKFRGVVDLHNSTALLPDACKNRMKDDDKGMCMFPQYVLKYIQTPHGWNKEGFEVNHKTSALPEKKSRERG